MTSTAMQLHTRSPAATTRLLVTRRDPQTSAYRSVGFLTHTGGAYTFAYLRAELERKGFRPLPGLTRATTGPVSSDVLFPLFAERVISSRRPDRHTSFEALGLPFDAAPMEVLARSHGQRVGDTIELLPAPDAGEGDEVAFTFLSHGVRHLLESEQERLSLLVPGEQLRLVPERTNQVNARAQLVTDLRDVRLGWLPDPLIDVVESINSPHVEVERANGPEVGFHFRLLARIEGRVRNGRWLFAGPEWETN